MWRGVESKQKEQWGVGLLLRDVMTIYSETLPADHQNVGICRVRLGDALAAEHRYTEAETESLGGYQILSSQSSGPQKWLQMARQDLASEYEALHQPEQAAKFRPAAAKP